MSEEPAPVKPSTVATSAPAKATALQVPAQEDAQHEIVGHWQGNLFGYDYYLACRNLVISAWMMVLYTPPALGTGNRYRRSSLVACR